jgi:hypothetical protein
MDRHKLGFMIVGGIGVALLIYLVVTILRDLGLSRPEDKITVEFLERRMREVNDQGLRMMPREKHWPR